MTIKNVSFSIAVNLHEKYDYSLMILLNRKLFSYYWPKMVHHLDKNQSFWWQAIESQSVIRKWCPIIFDELMIQTNCV